MNRRSFLSASLSAIPAAAVPSLSAEDSNVALPTGAELPLPARPPMGWNSFDAYDSRITEDEFLRCAEVIRRELLPHGWDTVVIDYIWFHKSPGIPGDPTKRHGHPNIRFEDSGEPIDRVEMDAHGRLLPAPERFPSAANGKGFKPIADKVHAMGLKFGIHIMRGIHRQAVWDKLPVLNSSAKANDIAEPFDTCQWCNHMFGVDASKPAAAEYYDSLFRLYAEWGVDFVKVDDVLFHPYHDRELELIDAARRKCGRPMILSTSCGEAAVSRAAHIAKHCNMWRISADFWDNWKSLRHNFDLLAAWSPWISPGQWPDADMIPIGKLSLDNRPHEEERMSRFTAPEKRTLMTLWSIARSPLMWGGDPLSLDDETKALLTNSEVLAVNQHSNDNRQLYLFNTEHRGQSACWVATDPSNGDRFIALFNLSDSEAPAVFNPEHEHMRGAFRVRDLWERKELGVIKGAHRVILPAHGAGLYRFSKETQS
jgi:alpha-galactosidase